MPITVQNESKSTEFQSPARSVTHQAPAGGVTVSQDSAGTVEYQIPTRSATFTSDELHPQVALEAHYDARYVNGLDVAPAANESSLAAWVDISGNLPSKNMVTFDTATFENAIGHWTNNNNCSVSRVQTQYANGSWSLQASSTAGGDFAARTQAGSAAVVNQPVNGGEVYTLHAMVRGGSFARTNFLSFAWVDAAGVYINSSTAGFVTSSTSGWTQLTCTALAPATARGFYTFWTVQATAGAAELHYLDNYGYWEGTSTDWVQPTRPARNLVQATELWKPQYISTSKNLLTHTSATFETDAGTWAPAGGAATLLRVSTEEHSGGYSLQVTKNAGAGDVDLVQYPTVTEGTTYTLTGSFKSNNSVKSCGVLIIWRNAGNGTISQSTGNLQAAASTWKTSTITAVAPAGAVSARIDLYMASPAENDVYFWDSVGWWQGSSTTWTPPVSNPIDGSPVVLCQGVRGFRGSPSTDWDFTSGPTARYSIYMVARVESPAVQAISSLMNTNPWSSSVDGFYLRQYDGSGGYLHGVQTNGVSGQSQMSVSTGASTALKNVWNVYSVVCDAAAPSLKISCNGTTSSTTTQSNPPTMPPHNQSGLGIGVYNPGAATYEQNVFYSEIIAYSETHSDAVRQGIERSLGSKYGITVL